MNKPARFRVADVVRAGKAAKELGPEWHVEVKPDGTIKVRRDRQEAPFPLPSDVEPDGGFVF